MADLSAVDALITDLNLDGLEWFSAVTQKPSAGYDPRLPPAPVVVAPAPVVLPGGVTVPAGMGSWLLLGALVVGAVIILRT